MPILRARLIEHPGGSVVPASGAAVMALGIVAIGYDLAGQTWAAWVATVPALVLWLALALVVGDRVARDRARLRSEAGTAAALTGVAATSVLGGRLLQLGWHAAAHVALALAVAGWLVLMPRLVRLRGPRTRGVDFLVCVATEAIAVLAAGEAGAHDVRWLAGAAAVLFVLGLLLYVAVAVRFDRGEVSRGGGDHWIVAGALAICALAVTAIAGATRRAGWQPPWRSVLEPTALVLLALSLLACLLMLVAEVRSPRPGYDVRRWATAFPVGMVATSSLSVGGTFGFPALRTLGEVVLWPAGALSLILMISALIKLEQR